MASFQVFISCTLVLSGFAIVVWYSVISAPAVQSQRECAAVQLQNRKYGSFWGTACVIWWPALMNFLVFFVSLALWPGLGCSLTPAGVMGSLKDWYCSPFIVASFNYGDLLGRVLPKFNFMSRVGMRTCGIVVLLRTVLLPPLVYLLCKTQVFGPNSALLLVGLQFVGAVTNGLVTTVVMGRAPLMVGPGDQEMAANVMTTALFAGLAGGSSLSACLDAWHVV